MAFAIVRFIRPNSWAAVLVGMAVSLITWILSPLALGESLAFGGQYFEAALFINVIFSLACAFMGALFGRPTPSP